MKAQVQYSDTRAPRLGTIKLLHHVTGRAETGSRRVSCFCSQRVSHVGDSDSYEIMEDLRT